MSELGKTIFKKIRSKILLKKIKSQCQNYACEKKPLAREGNLVQRKQRGLEWIMNGLGKPFEKKPIQKIEKTVKIKVILPQVNWCKLKLRGFF